MTGNADHTVKRFDPVAPVDVGCGKLMPLRSSRLAMLYDYRYDSKCAPSGAQDKQFEFDVVVVTTSGHWQFHGLAGKTEIDCRSMMVGVKGDEYSCRHDRLTGDSNLVVGLRPGSIEPDGTPLFSKQVVPAQGVLKLLQRAAQTSSDDMFDSLIFAIFDTASNASTHPRRESPSRVRIQRAKRFIEMHAFEPIRLADVALALGLSPFTCLRQFARATGKTPHAYLTELRIDRAKSLLKSSGRSVDFVARSVGFSDLAYFSRCFKQHTGFSPSAFRASMTS